MIKIYTFIFALFFSFSANACQQCQSVIWWTSDEAEELLENSDYKNDFYQLANFYQAQINPLYCGVATSVIILNAINYGKIPSQKELEVRKPTEMGGGVISYNAYSQSNFLNAKTDKIKDRDIIEMRKPNAKNQYDPGLTLDNLANILSKVHKLHVKLTYAADYSDQSLEEFRDVLRKYLNEDREFIIANFDGQVLETNTGGHISPIVAYDEDTDRVLVLDVAMHKNRWYFASIKKLYAAMNTKDGDKYRGFLVVGK